MPAQHPLSGSQVPSNVARMADLVALIVVYMILIFGVVVLRATEADRWRRGLVAYELHFPRGLEPANVAAWIGQLSGLASPWWQRLLAVRAIVLEVTATNTGISHHLLMPRPQRELVLGALRASLPAVRAVAQEGRASPAVDVAAALGLSNRHRTLRVEQPAAASAAILASLQPLESSETLTLQWVISPAGPQRPITNGRWQMTQRWEGGAVVQVRDREALRAARAKQAPPIFAVVGRLGVAAGTDGRRRQLLQRLLAPFHAVSAPGVHLLRRHLPAAGVAAALTSRRMPLFQLPLRLNADELTALVGWPMGEVALPGLRLGASRQLAPSPDIPSHGRVIGRSTFPGAERPLALSRLAALRHLHVIGPTGVGKSTLLTTLITADIAAGSGVVVIDPKSDLVTDVLARIPDERVADVVVLDPTDASRPVGLNVLAGSSSSELMVDQVVGTMHALWRDNWGPRLDDVLRSALLTLMTEPGMTLVEVPLLLTDPHFRRQLVGKLDDFILRGFWAQYDGWSEGERAQAIGPVLNKLRAFLLRRRVRNVIGQAEPRFTFDSALARRQVVLVPLAKGLLGEESAALLGSLVLARLWQAVQGRAALRPEERRPLFVYVDEVQDYLNLPTSLADLLAQARGLGLGLTIAHQHLGQLPLPVRHAVLANCASRIIFALGPDDARVLARELAPLTPADLQGLGAFEVAARLATDDGVAPPATAMTRPLGPDLGTAARVREQSRQAYGADAGMVEADMQRRHQPTPSGPVGRRRA